VEHGTYPNNAAESELIKVGSTEWLLITDTVDREFALAVNKDRDELLIPKDKVTLIA
jgi:hypothetical protein